MKKYIVAAVGGLVAFAISAFAASLIVDGGVLQSGIDRDLTCTDTAKVTYDHHVDYGSTGDAWVEAFFITVDDDCVVPGDPLTLYFTVEGQGAVVAEVTGSTLTIPVTDGSVNPGGTSLYLPGTRQGVPIADVEEVSVTIWSDANPTNGGHVIVNGYGYTSGIFAGLPV